MSAKEGKNLSQREKELWWEINQRQGVERARSLLELSKIVYEQARYSESLAMCESARDIYLAAGGENFLDEITDSNYGILNCYLAKGNYIEAAETAGVLTELFIETGHPMLDEMYRDQGRYWYSAGEYEKSIASHLKGMAIVNIDDGPRVRAIDLLNLGMAHNQLKEYQVAIAELMEAIEIFRAEKDPYGVSRCHGELTEIYFELGDGEQLQRWAKKALDYAELAGDRRWQYMMHFYLGAALRMVGDIDGAYAQVVKAKELALFWGETDFHAIVKIEKELAGLEKARGDAKAAEEILRRVGTIEETLLAS